MRINVVEKQPRVRMHLARVRNAVKAFRSLIRKNSVHYWRIKILLLSVGDMGWPLEKWRLAN